MHEINPGYKILTHPLGDGWMLLQDSEGEVNEIILGSSLKWCEIQLWMEKQGQTKEFKACLTLSEANNKNRDVFLPSWLFKKNNQGLWSSLTDDIIGRAEGHRTALGFRAALKSLCLCIVCFSFSLSFFKWEKKRLNSHQHKPVTYNDETLFSPLPVTGNAKIASGPVPRISASLGSHLPPGSHL